MGNFTDTTEAFSYFVYDTMLWICYNIENVTKNLVVPSEIRIAMALFDDEIRDIKQLKAYRTIE